MMKKQIKKHDVVSVIKDNAYVMSLLSIIVILAIVKYGRLAPMFLLAYFFKYAVFVFTLMFMPFMTGLAGFSTSIRKGWLAVLAVSLLPAVIFQALYHQSILRLWYQGEFDREYIYGLVQAATVVPGISFVAGLVVRLFLPD